MPFLAAVRARPSITILLLALYTLAVTLPHQQVQDWLYVRVMRPLGLSNYYFLMATLACGSLAAAAWLVIRRLARHSERRTLMGYSAFTVFLLFVAWRFLSVNNSELVHFPQYAVFGFAIMALSLSVTETLSWVLLIGGLDEANQYAVIHGGWGIPYDFNDVMLDLIGGMIGVMLCVLWLKVSPRMRHWRPGAGFVLLTCTVALGALMLLTDHALLYENKQRSDYWFALSRLAPKGFWFYDPTWGPRSIHALGPVEGPLFLAGLLFIYAWLDRRFEFRAA
ncbi:MAG: hypothetical protein K2X03_23330 [Bryobacteraceae bacterium]|nr:hypothetical protein [Bryobacteraceae bacterium]